MEVFMKIICTDKDGCGLTREYEPEENRKDEEIFCEQCPECGSVAFVYSDPDNCIYNKDYNNEDINKLIIQLYFLTHGELNEPDADN